ncbi:MAG TPA: glycoside hydrolase family 43 protein [Verrucomicrobiae bacterium]|nr:glycoside hydrolase family 43 protein [Verrucomicrobiae bacterium]
MRKLTIRPGAVWLDTAGKPIQAHGGGILLHDGMYYWFGENKEAPNNPGTTRVDVIGVGCYSSRNLVDWKNEGVVLPAGEGDLHPSGVLERPKVVYNRTTRQFVMWMHIDSADYRMAAAGVAVSDRATGPYRYLGSCSPNGNESRDMTVFQDSDGRAYLVHSSDKNSVIVIADLTDDYLRPTGHYTRHFDHQVPNGGRESPALFKHDGKYFIITSGCTGWLPNAAQYAVADSIHGPWAVKGNPCNSETTFDSQNTFVLALGDRFVFMADRWNKNNLRDSRYVWLPLEVEGKSLRLQWWDRWEIA